MLHTSGYCSEYTGRNRTQKMYFVLCRGSASVFAAQAQKKPKIHSGVDGGLAFCFLLLRYILIYSLYMIFGLLFMSFVDLRLKHTTNSLKTVTTVVVFNSRLYLIAGCCLMSHLLCRCEYICFKISLFTQCMYLLILWSSSAVLVTLHNFTFH